MKVNYTQPDETSCTLTIEGTNTQEVNAVWKATQQLGQFSMTTPTAARPNGARSSATKHATKHAPRSRSAAATTTTSDTAGAVPIGHTKKKPAAKTSAPAAS